MIVSVKKLNDSAVLPTRAHETDAGFDVVATDIRVQDNFVEYGTGLSFELPPNHMMLIFPRSSISKTDLVLANSVGVLDEGYSGELKIRFKVIANELKMIDGTLLNYPIKGPLNYYKVGERIAQIVIRPLVSTQFEFVDSLSETKRKDGAFGSSGR